jgi:hypothetical protein
VQPRLDAFAALLAASLAGPDGEPVAAHTRLPRLAVSFVAANIKVGLWGRHELVLALASVVRGCVHVDMRRGANDVTHFVTHSEGALLAAHPSLKSIISGFL